jgi:hypothetical protein
MGVSAPLAAYGSATEKTPFHNQPSLEDNRCRL